MEPSAVGYLATPTSGNGPGLIVIQEWWGLVDHIKDVCDRFAEAGFVALAPDLYHGVTVAEPDEAGKAMMALKMDQAARDMSGAVDALLQPSTGDHVGVIGFCMGGGLALVLATQRPDAVAAVVPCYGVIAWPDAQPDYSQLSAAVLGHYAGNDDFFTPAAAEGTPVSNCEVWARKRKSTCTPTPTTPSSMTPGPRSTTRTPRPCCGSARWPSSISGWGSASPGGRLESVCYHQVMSARSRDLPRRSCLSTPGSNEKFLAKAPTVPADMTFLDLEDAVAPLEKAGARAKVVDAIKNLPWDERVLCVRVNAWDTEWTYGDVIEVVGNAGERLDEIMLPKVQSAAEVVALDLLLTQVEKNSGTAHRAHRH